MQQFILEEQLEVICDKEGIAWDEVQELANIIFLCCESIKQWKNDLKCKNGKI